MNLLNLFAKKSDEPPAPKTATLLNEQAIESLTALLGTIPDPDVVLEKAGMERHSLRALTGDDEVEGAMDTRREAIIAMPWRLEPGEGEVVDFIWEQLEPHMEEILRGAWSAVPYGYSVMERVYSRLPNNRYGLADVIEKPFEWFKPGRNGKLHYFPDDGSGGVEGVLVDSYYKFSLTVRNGTHRNPYGEALLSRLYWPWFFRHNGWNFWMQFLERHGQPILLGRGSKPDKLAEALAQVAQDAVIAVGANDEVTALESKGSGESFAKAEEALVRRIQKVVLGQTLTSGTDGGSGNRALGEVHNQVRMDKRNADVRLVSKTVQQIINALVRLNYGELAEAPEFIMEDGQGLEVDRAERDGKLYNIGVRFKPEYIIRTYDLEPDEFEVTDGKPAVPPPSNNDDDAQASLNLRDETMALELAEKHHFAANKAVKNGQAKLDRLGDEAVEASVSPIPASEIRKAILAAKDEDDLIERFAALLNGSDPVEFRENLERALYAADVMGFGQAEQEG